MAMSTGQATKEDLSKMLTSFCIFNLLYCIANAETYNTYFGVPADNEEIAEFQEKNISNICLSNFEPCDENEWSRVDGSCNNLEHPTLGMYHTPMWRMLPANYSDDYEPRKTESGKDFPLARSIRSMLLKVGDSISEVFATSFSYFAEFVFGDVGSVHDISLYLNTITHCCQPEGLTDKRCTPNFIPEDDNVHRFSNIKCHNLTRPLSFQSTGCVPNNTVPERINFVTTFFDLSNIYLHTAGSIEQNRAYEGGRLKVEVVNGASFPSDANETTTCYLKDAVETGCTRNVPNGLLGTNLFSTWFWRYHNYVADNLAKLNPCWNDTVLWNNAKDVTIAFYTQILLYEFFPLILGRKNMINNNIIGSDGGFRDPYDKNVTPNLAIEFAYAWRWFHTTQDARQGMYDKNDNFINTQPVVDYSLRVQSLPFNDTLLQMTHGLYMQPAGGFDDTVHPDIADFGLGRLAKAFDICTADIARGRYFGLAPYIQYRDYCSDYTIKHENFEDLSYIMKPNKIDELRRVYGSARNVEVMGGSYAEDIGKDNPIPPTIACILSKQLQRSVASNRHLYERPNRPHAFTEDQLQEVRKSTLAALFCAVGDEVSEIQPQAFLRIGPGNYKVSCEEIPAIDFGCWKDESCDADGNL